MHGKKTADEREFGRQVSRFVPEINKRGSIFQIIKDFCRDNDMAMQETSMIWNALMRAGDQTDAEREKLLKSLLTPLVLPSNATFLQKPTATEVQKLQEAIDGIIYILAPKPIPQPPVAPKTPGIPRF